MEKAAAYVAFANRWNWDPERVDSLPLWLYDRMLVVATLVDEVTADKQKADAPG